MYIEQITKEMHIEQIYKIYIEQIHKEMDIEHILKEMYI